MKGFVHSTIHFASLIVIPLFCVVHFCWLYTIPNKYLIPNNSVIVAFIDCYFSLVICVLY